MFCEWIKKEPEHENKREITKMKIKMGTTD
jgi:hypothetical protein